MIQNLMCHEKNIIYLFANKKSKAFIALMVKFLYLRSMLPGGIDEKICCFNEWR